MNFGGSSSKAGGDKQSKRTRQVETHHEETKTERQIEKERKTQGKEQIFVTAEVSYSINSS